MLMAGLSPNQKPRFELVNVNSHSLGVVGVTMKTREKANAIVIPKNTPLPCRKVRQFQLAKANQASVCVPVVEGESLRPEQCIALGECIVRDLPPNLPGGTRVEVEFHYAANGRLSVSARVPSVRQSAMVEIAPKTHRRLGTLDSWRATLCGDAGRGAAAGQRQPAPPAVSDLKLMLTDHAALAKRLDDLYAWIGSAAAARPMPARLETGRQSILANQREFHHADAARQQAELAIRSAVGAHETARLTADVLRARATIERVNAQLRNSYISLGREAIAANLPLPEMAPYLAELRRLQQLASRGA
jgi:molecular chaperone DnaK (HSP70)